MRNSFFFIVTVVLLSCNSTKNLPRVNPTVDQLINTSWALESIKGEQVSKDDYMKGLPALNFREKGVLDGMTGCNSFSGKYAIGEKFKLDPGAMTKMNCPGSGEQDFLNAMENTTQLLIQGEDLLFLNKDEEVLRFEPASNK